MAFTHGRLTYVSIDAVDLSAWIDNSNWPQSADSHETTTYGKSWKTFASGLKTMTATIGGLYDAAAGGPEDTLRALVGGAAVAFIYGPEGNTTGKVSISGNCIVTRFEPSNPVGDMVRWTADLQITDVTTVGTFA